MPYGDPRTERAVAIDPPRNGREENREKEGVQGGECGTRGTHAFVMTMSARILSLSMK